MANTNEPDFSSLWQSLKLNWDADKFEKEAVPILSASVRLEDLDNANKCKIYNY